MLNLRRTLHFPSLLAVGLVLAFTGSAPAQEDPFSLKFKQEETARGSEKPGVKEAAPGDQPKYKDPRTAKLVELLDLSAAFDASTARPGQVVTLKITGKFKNPKAYTYPVSAANINRNSPDAPVPEISYAGSQDLKPLWPVREPDPATKEVDIAGKVSKFLVLKKDFVWEQDFLVSPEAKSDFQTLKIEPVIQVCDESSCYGPAPYPTLTADLFVEDGPAVAVSDETKKRLERPKIERAGPSALAAGPEGRTTFWGLLAFGALGALAMLFTPCVFPMIPVTVNFFLKQSEKEHHNPLMMASTYSGTIIVVLTAVIFVVGQPIIQLATNEWFNLFMGVLLVYFGLSLFGMYEVGLPSFLTRFTASQEGHGGMLGTVFMALTFTITSFTCTGPILGLLLSGVAGSGIGRFELAILAIVYSAVFALPFFLLAMFPSLLRSLPKSGGWLNTVKVTMGFVEIAAALKFLANADSVFSSGNFWVLNNGLILALWIALSIACGLYLLGFYRLPHDDAVEKIGVVRMLFAVLFIGLAFLLFPMFSGERQKGILQSNIQAWLPQPVESDELPWTGNLEKAWAKAKKDGKLMFIDFTGMTCNNCRLNENNVFTKEDVQGLLKQYELVQLYTDVVPPARRSTRKMSAREEALRNVVLQNQLANSALPSYVIFRPDPKATEAIINGKLQGEIFPTKAAGTTSGLINNVDQFVRFLEQPLEAEPAGGTQVAARKQD